MGVLKVSVCNVKKTSNISITISYPENSWHEVHEINIIFGRIIYLILNVSYKEGFGERYEDTSVLNLIKDPNLNPSLLCDDVYNRLKEGDVKLNSESIMKIISDYNKKDMD